MRNTEHPPKTDFTAMENRLTFALGPYEASVRAALRSLETERFSQRLWKKDAALWKPAPAFGDAIRNRLGWLTVTGTMAGRRSELSDFARSVREAGVTQVVLLGMGGSSLCPEVLRETFGVRAGYPDLHVLDSTDPAAILNIEKRLDLKQTLFILASKSGTTIEVESLYRYFREKVRAVSNRPIGSHFIAVTDPGTALAKRGREEAFRRVFLNPPDIGGRYSALSYFGLVPAALIGMNIGRFLERAEEMVRAAAPSVPAVENPAMRLGAVLGRLAREGRDKATFLADPEIERFGVWAEQLLAESTGKEGKGIVPIEGERIDKPDRYHDDRLFISLSLTDVPNRGRDRKLSALERAGHPVVRIRLRDAWDLAGQFFLWEAATAAAGAVMAINPFDEPNVTESKENTRKVLEEFRRTGRLPSQTVIREDRGLRLCGDFPADPKRSLREIFESFLDQAGPHDYLALMAYLERSGRNETLLQALRLRIRDRLRIATTLGYGPRFLHSTGQLHKGGAGNGLFLQITAEDEDDRPIPGEAYSFGILKGAQALGDFSSLSGRGLRVLRIHLGLDLEKGLKRLVRLIRIKRRS